jgi:hypothetical protein
MAFIEELMWTCGMTEASASSNKDRYHSGRERLQVIPSEEPPGLIVLFLTAQHIANIYHTTASPVIIKPEETIEFVEMTMLLSMERQNRILEILCSLLVDSATQIDSLVEDVDDFEIDEMVLEMLNSKSLSTRSNNCRIYDHLRRW